ncbi:hypothetical protein QEG26_003451 [Stenotrophomonas maltophilia]|nr:hypothetical protein [Stenotrophomonas maltophilia]
MGNARGTIELVGEATGVLIGSEILDGIRRGALVHGANEDRVRGCSCDLTVGTIFWKGKILRRRTGEDDGGRGISSWLRRKWRAVGRWLGQLNEPKHVVVPPGGVVGIFTAETLDIPLDMCATAFAINAMSSKGFLVLNPGHVDPGFRGSLTVKALNIRKTNITITQGEPIFTVVFQRLGQETGEFSNAKSVEDRERDFHNESVQSSPDTLGQMISVDPSGPYPTREQVKEMVRSDAINRATMILSLVAAIAAVGAWMFPKNSEVPPSSMPSPSASSQSATTLNKKGDGELAGGLNEHVKAVDR